MTRRRSTALATTAILSCAASAALGAPYASGVNEVAGQVTFRLNENADGVTVIRDGVASSLGAQNRGSITFGRNGAVNYSIVAVKNSGPGYAFASAPGVATPLQISDDSNLFNYERVNGLAINRNPSNGALFGRTYVANARSLPTVLGRSVTDGIYLLNGDYTDAVGQGDTARDAGLIANFVGGGNSSPWRLQLDDAGQLYIADWADATGTIYRTDANVSDGSGVQVLVGQGSSLPTGAPTNTLNHGSVGSMVVTGSTAGGNLVIHEIDEDLGADGTLNSMWRFDINGSTLPYNGIPTMKLNGVMISDTTVSGGIITDMSRRYDGKLYVSQNRSDGNEVGVVVTANDGTTVLFNSLTESRDLGIDGNLSVDGVQDVLRQVIGHDVSPDGRYMAIQQSGGDSLIVPLLAGIPDLRNVMTLDTFTSTTSRGEAAFDAAGNLYVTNAGDEFLRVFSPGGLSVMRLNSNGTFSALPEWTGTSGNINDASKWLVGAVPNGANSGALFGPVGSAVTVTANTPTTLGNIQFNNASGYTISGASTITLAGGSPEIRSVAGSHTISAPVLLTQSTGLVIESGTTTLSNLNYSATPAQPISIFKGGAGTAAVNSVRVETLRVLEGTMKVLANGTATGTGRANRLLIAGGTTPTAKLDISNNAFVVDYAPAATSPLATIQAQIKAGYNGGAWTGQGITTSNGDANHFAIGYGEASALSSVPAIFGTVDATAVLFRETRYGDATLDGTVNLSDFNKLASNFGQTGKNWTDGDFNYDGSVNLNDFNLLAGNFGLSAAGSEVTPQDWSNLAAAVPEPSLLILTGVPALAGTRSLRRRRSPRA